ncbi:MAG: Dipeptide transport system permease protein DppB [Gammaproteobacteria bacterium]|nr:Dipeptide transport system permease protein DppB [Gammaproteobacteria bacterium]
MIGFLLTRLFSLAAVALGVVSLVFLLLHLVPGDPVEVMLGESATPADRGELRRSLGLDQPIAVQWARYLGKLSHGQLGESLHSREPIVELVTGRVRATAQLGAAALVVSIAIGLPLGVGAALRDGRRLDRAALALTALAMSIPSFWLGPMLILLFSITLGWLPVSGRAEAGAIVLPALTLGIPLAAALTRMVRASMLQVLSEDYLRTARAKGLPPARVTVQHALRNAALPIMTVLGLQLGGVLAGAIITETIFQWPGLGQLTIESIQRRDYPVVQACVLIISLTYVVVNAATDMLCGLLDPRVRMA